MSSSIAVGNVLGWAATPSIVKVDRGPQSHLSAEAGGSRGFRLESGHEANLRNRYRRRRWSGCCHAGRLFAKIFSRRGLHVNAYNAYQSIIRGGHTFLTIRTGSENVTNMGDRIDLLIPLNQDAMDRHLGLLTAGAACIYNADMIEPGTAGAGVQLCALPVSKLADITRNKVAQNTLAIGGALSMMGIGFQAVESVLTEQFKKKNEAVVAENVGLARAGYEYATKNFVPFASPLPMTENQYAVLSGNTAMAMGGGGLAVLIHEAHMRVLNSCIAP